MAKRAPIPPAATRAAACVAAAAAFDGLDEVEDDAVLALAGRDEDALAGTLELGGVVGRLLAADATALPLEGTAEEPDG
jgi:hypothetical protein